MTQRIEIAPEEKLAANPEQCRRRAELIAQLFKDHNDNLVRFLAARLRSRQEAREVAQEAYVRLLTLDQPEAVGFLRAFLFKTAENLAIDRQRSRSRRAHLHETAFFAEFQDVLCPERAAMGEQEIEIFSRLLEELPPKCRNAFLLNRVHGLRPDEIARQMNVAERTVRHYILHALLHCRAGLGISARKDEHHG